MIRGPVEYVPPVEMEVVTKRTAIPLDENEGIYVRNVKNGKVREVTGETYMLNQDEELWEKDLPPGVESLLALEKDPLADRGDYLRVGKEPPQLHGKQARDKTKVVTFRVPHNAAVQIYDYKEKKARYGVAVCVKFEVSKVIYKRHNYDSSHRAVVPVSKQKCL